jgi:hypothetical protein
MQGACVVESAQHKGASRFFKVQPDPELTLIEYALSCLLQSTASADWGYHLARRK